MFAACAAFGSDITGSAHDFSAAGWADGEICKPCHTPHNADISLTGRLWAHTMSTATYKYHGGSISDPNLNDNSVTTEAATGVVGQTDMDSASRLCLSCHDGTVALDSFMGKNGGTASSFIGTGGDRGDVNTNLLSGVNDLANDHPVGYRATYKENAGLTFDSVTGLPVPGGHARYKTYASAAAKGLKFAFAPAGYNSGASAIGPGRTQDGTPIGTYTISGRAYTTYPSVSCVTCHNVHNSGASDEPGLLRISNLGSGLCLSCHDK